jgi:hypothetical protein
VKDSARALTHYLRKALERDAPPENSDIEFTLSLLPPAQPGAAPSARALYMASILGSATYSLREILAEGADVESASIPVYASPTFMSVFERYQGDVSRLLSEEGGAMSLDSLTESFRRHHLLCDVSVSIYAVEALKAIMKQKAGAAK